MRSRFVIGIIGAAVFGLGFTASAWVGGQRDPSGKVTLASGEVGYIMPPIAHRNLAIYPIRAEYPQAAGSYITLDEGLKTGQVEVRETGANPPPLVRPRPPVNSFQSNLPYQRGQSLQAAQGFTGEVNRLVLYNHSDRKLLLIAGEMVVGGKQDRIVQKDRIVPPSEKPYDLNVFCVEHGRWTATDANFKPAAIPGAAMRGGGGGLGGGIADPAVRGAAQSKADQQAVWDEVGKKNSQLGAAGHTTYQTARLNALNLGEEKGYAEALEDKLVGGDIVGVIVAVNGKPIWMDQFDNSSLLRAYWPKLLRSYILEAVTSLPAKDIEDRIKWKLPTVNEAATYLMDRSGTSKFEGEEGVFKLNRIESSHHVIYELSDLNLKHPDLIHICKMEKK
jgi:hypothetical protein